MSPREARPPLLVRALLACLPLGGRRGEIEADVTELFETRVRTHGRLYASQRLVRDVLSLGERSGGPGAWLLDLRHGLRLFGKHPCVIGATVGGLALAIAVSTTVFTILNASVLRPYGMDDPASIVWVQMFVKQGMANEWPYHAFADMRERARLSRVEASIEERARFSMTAGETPAGVDPVLLVSGGYLPALGGDTRPMALKIAQAFSERR